MLAVLFFGLFSAGVSAQAPDCPVLPLTGSVESSGTAGYIAAQLDPDWTLTVHDMAGAAGDGFELLDTHIPGFGYIKSRVWLRICAQNDTPDVSDWVFYTHENFFQFCALHMLRADGSVETPIDLRPDSAFAERPLQAPELVAPMTIAPGEAVTILVSYWSGGSSQLDFSIRTAGDYDATAARKTAKNFLFYGMVTLLIAVAFIAWAVFRHRVFLYYIAYAASALLFVMHGDGVAFQYLWPWFPGFNGNATIVTGGCLIIFGAAYARVFLRTPERHPLVDKALFGFIAVTIALTAALYFTDPQLLKRLLVMLSLASFLTCIVAGLVSYFSGHREARFYLVAWISVVLSSTMMNLRHVLGLEISQEAVHDSMRAVLVFDAVMMGLAIADRFNQMRKSQQQALEENLTAAKHYLDLNQRFAELQSKHELAVELSKTRNEEFQNVIHDLRQPLHALRLNIASLNSEKRRSGDGTQSIESSFSYLEDLISHHLHAPPAVRKEDAEEAQAGAPGLQEILAAVEEMFAPDAADKGLTLRRVPSRLEAEVNPLVLTRIVSNLVANAIKYTETGGVLIGTRRRGDTVCVEVHDSGSGMDAAEFERARQRSVRLAQNSQMAEGSGLGLAIVIDLAKRHGLTVRRSGLRQSGTGVIVEIAGSSPGDRSGGATAAESR